MVKGEVDPIDFITIEIIRLSLPKVYDLIKLNPKKFLLTDQLKHQKQEIVEFHENWLNTIEDDRKQLVRNVIKRLFPRWDDIWQDHNNVNTTITVQEKKYHRISVPDYFDIYFEFSVPSNLGQRNHVRNILNQLDNPQEVKNFISELKNYASSNNNSLAYYFINYIDDNIKDFSQDQIKSLVTILSTIDDPVINSDDYAGEPFFHIPGRFRLEWLFKSLILQSKIAEDIPFIRILIEQSKHLYLLTYYIHVSTTEDPDQQSFEMYDYTQEQKEILINAMIDKYKSLTDEELISQIGLWNILFKWKLWDNKSFQSKLRSVLDSSDTLLKFLKALKENSNEKFDLNSLQKLTDIDELYRKVDSVKANLKIKDELQLVDSFSQSYKNFKKNPNPYFAND